VREGEWNGRRRQRRERRGKGKGWKSEDVTPAAGIGVTSKTYHVTKARRTWNRNNSHSLVLASMQIRNTVDLVYLYDREEREREEGTEREKERD